jgi:RES domain-containing protein
MRVWRVGRLSDTDKLAGIGGRKTEGRWHHQGYEVVYTAATPSLAALEMLIYYDPDLAPEGLSVLEIDIPDDIGIERCDASKLTPYWKAYPYPGELQDFGTKWLLEKRTALLSVPSVVMPEEKNYLINPNHPDALRISLVNETPYEYDPRLLKHIKGK